VKWIDRARRHLNCAICDVRSLPGQKVAVIGGGNSAIEAARNGKNRGTRGHGLGPPLTGRRDMIEK